MTRTRKPCPGCGEIDPYRPSAEVCGHCRRKLENEAHLREALENHPNFLLLAHSSTYHWNPGFYGSYTMDSAIKSDLSRVFHDFVRCISGVVGLNEYLRHGQQGIRYLMERGHGAPGSSGNSIHGHGPDDLVRVTPEQQIAIRRLFRAIDEALASAYEEGEHAGGNLIRQLVAGEVSIVDYHESSRT